MPISINGQVKCITDFERNQLFYRNYTWLLTETASERLDDMITDTANHYFRSYRELLQALMGNIGNPLPNGVKVYHAGLANIQIQIEMTGSYIDDFIEASNQAAGYGVAGFNSQGRMSGYVWHHCENIGADGFGHWFCNMELLTVLSHSQPHCGGAHEYRNLYGGYD